MTEKPPPRRKERTPLSPEELHYFIKLKKLKQAQKTEAFKATRFYKALSYVNIVLIAIVTYFALSILIVCQWKKQTIQYTTVTYGEYNKEAQQRTISQIEVHTTAKENIQLKTSSLFQEPQVGETIYVGTDWLFGKHMKTKLSFDDRAFWLTKTYPSFLLCMVALLISLFVYRANLHLTYNGLLTVFGLLLFSGLYFIGV